MCVCVCVRLYVFLFDTRVVPRPPPSLRTGVPRQERQGEARVPSAGHDGGTQGFYDAGQREHDGRRSRRRRGHGSRGTSTAIGPAGLSFGAVLTIVLAMPRNTAFEEPRRAPVLTLSATCDLLSCDFPDLFFLD